MSFDQRIDSKFLILFLLIFSFLMFQLDDWVLCRIYKKKNLGKPDDQRVENTLTQIPCTNDPPQVPQKLFPRNFSLSDNLWEFDYINPISQLMHENLYNLPFNVQESTSNVNNSNIPRDADKTQITQVQHPCTSSATNFQGNQQPFFVNPVYEFQ